MKIFVDDIREPPDRRWVVFRDMQEALLFIMEALSKKVYIQQISLDHDMGINPGTQREYMNGYKFLLELEKWFAGRYCIDNGNNQKSSVLLPPTIIHSANPQGRANMEACLASIERFTIR